MSRLIQVKESGEWGIKGIDFVTDKLSPALYGALCKLKDYEEICDEPNKLREIDEFYREKCEEVNRLRKMQNSTQVEYKGGWIPCSERLPEQLEKVLVITDKGCYYIAMLNTQNEWMCFAEMVNTEITYSRAIAWQPLPEPYKE